MEFRTTDGLKLSYRLEGEGHPILCLPGLTRNESDFEQFFEAYSGRARLIAMSYRGREPSDFDPNWKNYNLRQEGLDAIALLDHLGIEKALWLGTSRGGLISMNMAHEHKARMAAVVLNDIGPEMAVEGLMRIGEYLGVTPKFATLDEAAFSLEAGMKAQFPTLGVEDWRKMAARFYRFDDGGAHLRYDAKLREALIEGAAAGHDYWADFEALEGVPLGLVWGVNSDFLDANGVLKMQEARLDLEVARIADRGHVPFLNEPEAIALIDRMMKAGFG